MIRRRIVVLALAALSCTLGRAQAGILADPGSTGFSPRVPLSAFARPASWFDRSRLRLSSTMSFGTGYGGGTSALNVTSLTYQFKAPFTLGVSVGNTFGLDRARGDNAAFFLEGLDLTWRPNRNSIFRIEMRDVRSPLQYGYSPYSRPGYVGDAFATPY